ncbi:dicarboxylate/amino acid:cation symporter [Feifania hominis]|uniref:Dicarboxylate/amino acid:cation symporter n=1 Tax=Feifania hominis TaxID=2763660 RepID=A0A926HTP0_9FIRM|nr:dicarboxylate/amino acid:cation symporter [Feifania hominis]MBC8535085.1 dicarboxylate/amino acid:cation symporter [Feifania hominis]
MSETAKKQSFWKQYRFPLILIISIIIGCIVGIIMGKDAVILKPLGTIFMNLLFVVVVPLVLISVTSAIANFGDMKKLGRLIATMFIVFIITSIIASVFMLVVCVIFPPAQGMDVQLEAPGEINEFNTADQVVAALTVDDFSKLLSKENLLPLIIFSILLGVAINMVGEKGKKVASALDTLTEVMMKLVQVVMYTAPVGLLAFFAALIGDFGPNLFGSYFRCVLVYHVALIIYGGIFLTFYAYVGAGKLGVSRFWKYSVTPILTAFGTQSSVASLPANLEAAEKIGIPKRVRDVVLLIGASAHTEAACLSGILKIAFLFGILGLPFNSIGTFGSALLVAILSGVVMCGIPGGGLIGEMLIVSLYGFPLEVFPLIVTIGWLIDPAATVLAVIGDTTCAMIIARFTEGKNWLIDHVKGLKKTSSEEVVEKAEG